MTTELVTNRDDEDRYLAARKSILGAAQEAADRSLENDRKAAAEHKQRRQEADKRHEAARIDSLIGGDSGYE